MADNFTIRKDWLDSIYEDENLEGVTEQEMAYIVYASVKYGLTDEKINISKTFGEEFRHLNWAMPNIWGQIDKIRGYNKNQGDINRKYDNEAIKKLRLEGKTAKQICIELGYEADKWRSITSNKGWTEAGQILQNMKQLTSDESVSDTESESVVTQKMSEKSQKMTQTDSETDKKSVIRFDF